MYAHPARAEGVSLGLSFGRIDYKVGQDKAKITRSLLEAAKKAKTVTNLVFLSSAGCDYAEKDKQPRLREFIALETLAMAAKSDTSSEQTGHSPCIVR